MANDPHAISRNKKVLQSITGLIKGTIPHFQASLMAELHARVAYGVSCFLMVAMGGRLGHAPARRAVHQRVRHLGRAGLRRPDPGVHGQGNGRNPNVNTNLGLAAIWSGIVALLAANIVLYVHLSRK